MSQSDYDKRTALHLAVCENHIQIVKFLVIIAKVNVNIQDRWNNTPYDEAVRLNHEEIISVFDPYSVKDKSMKQKPPSSKKPPLAPSKRKEWVKHP